MLTFVYDSQDSLIRQSASTNRNALQRHVSETAKVSAYTIDPSGKVTVEFANYDTGIAWFTDKHSALKWTQNRQWGVSEVRHKRVMGRRLRFWYEE